MQSSTAWVAVRHHPAIGSARRVERKRSSQGLLYLLGPEAREVEGDALTADTGFRARFATSFDRVAVVSDETWMRPAMRALSFLLPGKAKAFPVAELEAAKAWLAENGA